MTVPIWSPFAALLVVCTFCPPPTWMRQLRRRADWVLVAAWLLALVYSVGVWYGLYRLVEWAA